MRHLILFTAVFLSAAPVMAQETAAPLEALQSHCIAALEKNEDPSSMAAAQELSELPREEAAALSPGGGRAFVLPGLNGNAVLLTNPAHVGACSVAVRETDAQALWKAADRILTKGGFRMMREKRSDDQNVTKKEFRADRNGPIIVIMTVSDTIRTGQMQALMTAARPSR